MLKRPLSGDFDPEAHEKLMSEVLKNYGEGEEEFDEDGEIVKPEFSDFEEWEEEIKAEKRKKKVSKPARIFDNSSLTGGLKSSYKRFLNHV